jgi:hypothetical protein
VVRGKFLLFVSVRVVRGKFLLSYFFAFALGLPALPGGFTGGPSAGGLAKTRSLLYVYVRT